jgi:predicted O-methyltransferase YrrM
MIPWNLLGDRLTAFERITAMLPERCVILETGTIREAGNWIGDGQSTVVWDHYAELKSGHVTTVDLDPNCAELVTKLGLQHTTAITGDSLQVIPTLDLQHVDFLYLDSFDVDFANPEPASAHHLSELKLCLHLLNSGSIVAVDDNRNGSGKGTAVAAHMAEHNIPEIVSGYVRVWRIP